MKNKAITFKKILMSCVSVSLTAAILVCSGCSSKGSNDSSTKNSSSSSTTAQEVLNPLTGMSGYSSSAVGKRPVAIVVSNAPKARPQWGITTPDILVEGLVEGGITRMLAIYADSNKVPDKIGPMRSARHDFVEIAEGFDAIYVHWGWSTYAKNRIAEDDVDHINGNDSFKTGTYFYRDNNRRHSLGLEHSGYTTGESLNKAISDLKFRTDIKSDYQTLYSFNKEGSKQTPAGGTCSSVSFKYSYSNKHKMTYSADEGKYQDTLNDNQRKDADGNRVEFTNVLLLFCKVSSMGDSAGCIDMSLENGGNGYYLSNGSYEKIKWSKSGGHSASIKLTKTDGSELKLNAGNSYFGIVPSSNESSVSIS